MVHRGKCLAEPIENPMLTACSCSFLAGNRLAIQRANTVTAVQPGSERLFFEHSQEVTLWIPLSIGKDQPSIPMHRLAHFQQFD